MIDYIDYDHLLDIALNLRNQERLDPLSREDFVREFCCYHVITPRRAGKTTKLRRLANDLVNRRYNVVFLCNNAPAREDARKALDPRIPVYTGPAWGKRDYLKTLDFCIYDELDIRYLERAHVHIGARTP